jgi:hypothetical protein
VTRNAKSSFLWCRENFGFNGADTRPAHRRPAGLGPYEDHDRLPGRCYSRCDSAILVGRTPYHSEQVAGGRCGHLCRGVIIAHVGPTDMAWDGPNMQPIGLLIRGSVVRSHHGSPFVYRHLLRHRPPPAGRRQEPAPEPGEPASRIATASSIRSRPLLVASGRLMGRAEQGKASGR